MGAGGDHRPDSLAPPAAFFAPRPLRDVPVNHHEANRLLGQVVRWVDARCRDEAEVRFPIFTEPFRQIPGVPGVRHTCCGRPHHSLPRRCQGPLKRRRLHLLTAVDHAEEIAQGLPQTLAVSLNLAFGERQQVLHVADQVDHGELHQHIAVPHVLAVGAEVVAAQHPVELLAQHFHEDLRAPRLVGAKERVKLGAEAPGPELLAVFFVPGLVDVQHGLARQTLEQLRVRRGQRFAHLADELGQIAAGNVHPHHVAEELADRGERGVADAFHEGDQRGQPRTEQARLHHRLGHRGVMHLAAVRAPVGQPLMFRHDRGRFRDFHLLEHFRLTPRREQPAAAVRAAVERVKRRENTHPWPPDQDQSPARQTQELCEFLGG